MDEKEVDNMNELILASQSPRRKALLHSLGYKFESIPPELEEELDPSAGLDQALLALAKEKAQAVFAQKPQDVVLAADTIVCLDDQILGKPKNRAEARKMLESLSGRTHEVKTALCILAREREIQKISTSKITFYPLSSQQIEDYLNRGTYLDKAGSYGIQETPFVEKVEGSYTNVVGLPICLVGPILSELQDELQITL